jgi:hypothetical protein
MDQKRCFRRRLLRNFGRISEQTVSENCGRLLQAGQRVFLLEIMNLKAEIETLKEELENRENNKAQTLRELLVQ